MMFRTTVLSLALLCLSSMASFGAEESPEDLQKVVDASVQKYAAAFASHDAKALAALFTEAAEYVDASGTIFHGRDAIEAEASAWFSTESKGTLSVELLSIRPIASGVLVEEGLSTFVPDKGEATDATHYVATHVQQTDGTWLIASVREISVEAISPKSRVQALAWLVGDWHEEAGDNVSSTTWAWDPSQNYLVSKFSITGGTTPLEGTHRIGWDAERRQLRSWVFESSGAFAEGTWKANTDATWSVQLTRIDSRGIRTTTQLTYGADGTDALIVSIDEMVGDGVSIPGGTHRIVRRPPAADVPKTSDAPAAAPAKKSTKK